METTITARHCEIGPALRERASSITGRLGTVASRPMDATVVFDQNGLACVAEIRFRVARGDVLVASAEVADHRTALDRAEEKLRRQLEKTGSRYKAGRHAGTPDA